MKKNLTKTKRSNDGSLQAPVLVLNASFEPLHVTSVRRAMTLIFKGVASAEENVPDHFVHSHKRRTPTPTVIRLQEYRCVPRGTRAISRKNILIRDGYTCQYCGKQMVSNELTLDHIIPRSKGGGSVWENLVAACYPCNNRKGSKSLEESGMVLARQPRPFTVHTSRHLIRQIGRTDPTWDRYMFI